MSHTDSPVFLRKLPAAGVMLTVAFFSFLFISSCSSLSSSQIDREMRANGRYSCPEKRIAHTQTPASGDFQVRCYRDSVSISGTRADWSRAFYSDADCSGSAIGFGEWNAMLKDTSRPDAGKKGYSITYAEISHRRIQRKDSEWYLDAISGCDLRKLNIEAFAFVDYESPCARLFPRFEDKDSRSLHFASPSQGSSESVSGAWDGQTTLCTR